MMTNLFSVFDPSTTILNLSLNWLSTFLGLLLIPFSFWLLPNRFQVVWNNILLTLHKEFKTLLGPSGHNGSTLMFISLFSLIMFNNFLGLFPYIFTSTSHLTLTLALAFPLWLSFMLYGWINHTQHMFAHLVPQGTPPVLMPFMVCIETISNVIRPGTLAVRLTANMIAGHLLLTLLGNTGPMTSNYIILSLILTTQIALLVLESAVAIIQSYVFAVLSTLYSSEVN
uniref:ATP synthase subunit a n=2 Tax=Myzorhynchus TaxID=58250 RepID=A0A0M5KPZ0_ANOSI|nr:ATP synthase F0 subunit 6 [Anopheles sinensis]YP_010419974.1 ATP synthase F0 subunit 6 [Anopheles coustani]YP_010700944.1 ATP synthase F0 subunit 6 [Anopheles belenrae]YP_010700970.1 ATP synthase F0 subunit 6 [Anopheles junlianensis]YP_010700996.1 ATP synthase F0 subunit 6 [Anopheles kunmingensis]YP_010701009.1 ATP synthase F0 subunit 6 [Anopheles lesteri]YP_010701022.1 ATP synthase F0 subunit 6 [Anopheles liangshanensis]YP_010701035.1 ATP synthase F0 subunit 6 [Anopheles peditaeniatus]Y